MTTDYSAETDDKINQTIVEIMGWTDLRFDKFLERPIQVGKPPGKKYFQAVPRFTESLDDMWDVEEFLIKEDASRNLWSLYVDSLITGTHAKARDKAIAFLTAWEERRLTRPSLAVS